MTEEKLNSLPEGALTTNKEDQENQIPKQAPVVAECFFEMYFDSQHNLNYYFNPFT